MIKYKIVKEGYLYWIYKGYQHLGWMPINCTFTLWGAKRKLNQCIYKQKQPTKTIGIYNEKGEKIND